MGKERGGVTKHKKETGKGYRYEMDVLEEKERYRRNQKYHHHHDPVAGKRCDTLYDIPQREGSRNDE